MSIVRVLDIAPESDDLSTLRHYIAIPGDGWICEETRDHLTDDEMDAFWFETTLARYLHGVGPHPGYPNGIEPESQA